MYFRDHHKVTESMQCRHTCQAKFYLFLIPIQNIKAMCLKEINNELKGEHYVLFYFDSIVSFAMLLESKNVIDLYCVHCQGSQKPIFLPILHVFPYKQCVQHRQNDPRGLFQVSAMVLNILYVDGVKIQDKSVCKYGVKLLYKHVSLRHKNKEH